jgi:hypothetical protein
MKPELIATSAELPRDVLLAIEQGHKIEAIQILREATGLGLANAKVLVDRASRQHAMRNPQSAISESDTGLPRLLISLVASILFFLAYRYLFSA